MINRAGKSSARFRAIIGAAALLCREGRGGCPGEGFRSFLAL